MSMPDDGGALLAKALVQSADPFIFMDTEARIKVWNRGAQQLFGWPPEEAIGQTIDIVLPDIDQLHTGIEEMRDDPADADEFVVVQNFETIFQHRDGTGIPVKITITLIEDDGTLLGSSVTVRDISREQNLENQLRNRTGEMALLDAVLHSVQGTLDLDRILRVILTAVTAGSGLGFNRAILFLVNDDQLQAQLGVGVSDWDEAARFWPQLKDIQDLTETIQHVLESGGSQGGRVESLVKDWNIPLDNTGNVLVQCVRDGETQVRSADSPGNGVSERLQTDSYAVVPLVHAGEAIGVIVADNTVTGRSIDEHSLRLLRLLGREASFAIMNGRLFERLLEHAAVLEEAYDCIRSQQDLIVQGQSMAALGQIVEAISHEITGPLVPIGGFARAMRRNTADGSEAAEMLDVVIQQVNRLEQVVKAVLAVASPPKPVLRPVDMRALLENEIFALYRPEIDTQNIRLVAEVDPDMPPPHLDYDQWRQLFTNLVANAISATPPGGKITVSCAQNESGGYRIRVSDTGVGVLPRDIPRVFSAFYNATPTGEGMGLNVVAQIIKLHNGSIRVESEPDRGTDVIIDVPAPQELHDWLRNKVEAAEEGMLDELDPLTVAAFRRTVR